MDLDFVSVHKNAKKRTWPISSHLDRTSLVNDSLNCQPSPLRGWRRLTFQTRSMTHKYEFHNRLFKIDCKTDRNFAIVLITRGCIETKGLSEYKKQRVKLGRNARPTGVRSSRDSLSSLRAL